jgi:hypothetical protein
MKQEDEKSERSGRSLERDNFVIAELTTRKEARATDLEEKEARTTE